MALTYFAAAPTVRRVRRLRTWLDHLLALNAERGLFPKEAFEARVQKAWNDLYHRLPAYGVGPSLEHLRLSGAFPMDRLSYLAKVRLKALLKPFRG
jgi:hypothetical protein